MDPTLKLFLVRHGETACSLSGQHTGLTDLPLTEHGEAQARALSHRLQPVRFSHILSSPRLRARSTCALAGLVGELEITPGLAEWDYGDYEGLRTNEIHQLRPNWDIWRDGCPAGETLAAIADRVDRLIALLRTFVGNVGLFSHCQFGRVLAARWIKLRAQEGRQLALDPTSVSILGLDREHALQPVIMLWSARPAA